VTVPGTIVPGSITRWAVEGDGLHGAQTTISTTRMGVGRRRELFQCEGDYWTIAFDGRTVRLRNAKGLEYLATLLARPGERVAVMELVASTRGRHPEAGRNGTTRPAHGEMPVARNIAAERRRTLETQRARVSVTKAIRSALARIAAVHPALGEHLATTVRRGWSCSYTPDPRHPVAWKL